MKNNLYILWANWFIWKHVSNHFSSSWAYNVIRITKDIYNLDFEIQKWSIVIHLARKDWSLDTLKENELKLKEYISNSSPSFVWVFSSAVIYSKEESEYKKEKIIIEEIWSNSNNSCIIRLFNCFWEFQKPYRKWSLIANILHNNINWKEITINDINQKRNFIYAWDIWKAIEYFIDNKLNWIQDIWNINIDFKKLLEIINKIIKLSNIKLLNKKEADFKVLPKINYNINYTDFSQALLNTYNFLKQNENNN